MVNERIISNTLVFFVNGKKIEDNSVEPEWTLLYYLRKKLRLCGTKLGCGEGGCGACTVMVSKYDRAKKEEIHLPVNACLAPVCSMHGLAVTTVEGIGSTKKLHPVQERIAKAHGSQCGFCTPGIVMSMYTLLRNSPKPNLYQLEEAFQGNLCRCTGYRPILEGYKTFTVGWETLQINNGLANGNSLCSMGDKCCKLANGTNGADHDDEEILFKKSEFKPYDPSQEPIFPPELKLTNKYDNQFLIFNGKNVTWYRPTTLEEVLDLKQQFPNAKIVVGNTEVGVEVKFKNMKYPVIIQPLQVPELINISEQEYGINVGASITFAELETYLKEKIRKLPEYKTRVIRAMVEMLNYFAGKQIRSVGALGSNIMTGSPISDMIPILMANKVKLQVASKEHGAREVSLDGNFFTGYRKNTLKPSEILLAIKIPFTKENQYFYSYKQARRKDDDIAIVNAAINVQFLPETHIIEDINLAFGGMSFKTITAPKTQKALKGLPWNADTLELAFVTLLDDLPLDPSAPGGMVSYRKILSLCLFHKAYLAISKRLLDYIPNVTLDKIDLSGSEGIKTKHLKSSQYFTVVPNTQEKINSIHRPIVHLSAFKQATGEAIYCDDIPCFENELYMGFILSTKPNANILLIDPSEALAMEGVCGFFSDKDLTEEQNCIGTILRDEKVFFSKKVSSKGQIIAAVVAVDQNTAQIAARKVKVVYEELQPVIITMEDAIKHHSTFEKFSKYWQIGDIDKVMKEAAHVIEGECRMGGQEHFYLETQCVVAVPKREDDEMEIFCSTQNPSEISRTIAEVLGVQQNKIITRVKRVGGGFGGKEWKATIVAAPAALAAARLNRPVRVMLDRDEDIIMTGGRHPFLFKYKVAVSEDGKFLGCDFIAYNNAGYSLDLSQLVMEKVMTHFQNAYNIPVMRFEGHLCKTNLPSNTAFRGFGGPQGMFLAETMIHDIADHLGKDAEELSLLNLFRKGDKTFYNQILADCTLTDCWEECVNSSKHALRRKNVEKYNRENRFKKRGLSIVPTMFGVAFGSDASELFMNQGGALILVYTDGSVLLSHGGIEMGQGIHTKMIQVASTALEIPVEKIHISEVSTDKVPNTSPTAASSSSDLNGMAILEACNKIKERLKPYKEANPKSDWDQWVRKAYFDRVSLAATGFYKTPDLGYDYKNFSGMMFNYFTYGVACSEVEIDTLTGDHQVLHADIVMDLGQSLNPAIDIGQIEGAFMQGYGLFVLEEMMYSPEGDTYTRGPGTYKLPGFSNIPEEFNVSLLKGTSNPRAVYSSKAVGEPPLFLASSVFFAIRDAISAARSQNGITTKLRLNSPATAEKIRMACEDHITSRISEAKPGTFKPWNVVP